MTYSRAKVKGQRSVGSKDMMETKGRTEAIALPDSLMRSVIMDMQWVTWRRNSDGTGLVT